MIKQHLTIIKKALYRIEEEEIVTWEALPDTLIHYSDAYKNAVSFLIKKERQNSTVYTGWTVRKKAIALTLAIIVSIIAITSCVFNKQIKKFFVDIYDTYTAIGVDGTPGNEHFIKYLPTNLPDGYVVATNTTTDINAVTSWYNGTHYIHLQQIKASSGISSIDTENTTLEEIEIDGTAIYRTHKNETYCIAWILNDYEFYLVCQDNISWDEIEIIITSMSLSDQ
ncbi:MAG: DUF4367 domain-containing protein [Clostridia bacterium]|nr:DUF4367 domain-containing protein [Clostridia bacterium]